MAKKKRFKLFNRKPKAPLTAERLKRRKRRRIILLSILGVLIIFRLILPFIVLKYVNKQLANLEQYWGHVDDIDIHLYRGAYVINDMEILKLEKGTRKTEKIPFFKCPKIDLSVEWSALFDGEVVGEIYTEKPVLNFVKGAHKGEDVAADTADFRQLVDALMPIKVNRFGIKDGEVHYIDHTRKPNLDISMKNIEAEARNLSNVNESNDLLPAYLNGTGNAYDGKFKVNVKFDALAKQPTFDLNTSMDGLNLVKVNDFLRAYGNFDVKKGTFGLYAEFAAKDGHFGGYVKPILKDLDVVQFNKEEGSVPQILWESLVGFGAEILQNQKEEQLATKIPIKGTFQDADVDVWRAIAYILRNAFLQALKPSVDNSININKMEEEKGFMKGLFKKDDKGGGETKKEKRKSNRKKRRG